MKKPGVEGVSILAELRLLSVCDAYEVPFPPTRLLHPPKILYCPSDSTELVVHASLTYTVLKLEQFKNMLVIFSTLTVLKLDKSNTSKLEHPLNILEITLVELLTNVDENLISVKERKFKKGLQRRLELISFIQGVKLAGFDWRAIDITFTRNLPSNDTEIAEMINKLSNVVSKETLLAQVPFVEDVQAELDRLDKEQEKNPFYDLRLGLMGEEDGTQPQEADKDEEAI